MTRTLAVLLLTGGIGAAGLSADSNSAHLTIGATVVRSCSVDASSSPVRLACTAGAHSNVRVSESIATPAGAVVSDGLHVVTLNF